MTSQPASEEAKLFAQGFDQYLETGHLTTLKLLPKQYPQGEWRTRAEGVIDIVKQQQQQQTQIKQINQGLKQCKAEKDLLVEDNKVLQVTLEQLKQAIIDTELRVN